MKQTIKDRLKAEKLPINPPNRKQGKTLPLCDCGDTKKSHFNNAKNHPYRGNKNFKNNLSVTTK